MHSASPGLQDQHLPWAGKWQLQWALALGRGAAQLPGGGWMMEPADSWRVGGTWRQGQEAVPGVDLSPGPPGAESFSFAAGKVSTRTKGSSFPSHLS